MCKNEQLAARMAGWSRPGRGDAVLFAARPRTSTHGLAWCSLLNIVHKNGQSSPLYARADVDNAETVRNNEILGIIQPHASKKMSVVMAAFSAANPIAGYTVKGVQTVYGLSLRRSCGHRHPGTGGACLHAEAEGFLGGMAEVAGRCRAAAVGDIGTDAHPHSEQDAFGYDQSHVHRLSERTVSLREARWFRS
jgi:hypothetical protein